MWDLRYIRANVLKPHQTLFETLQECYIGCDQATREENTALSFNDITKHARHCASQRHMLLLQLPSDCSFGAVAAKVPEIAY